MTPTPTPPLDDDALEQRLRASRGLEEAPAPLIARAVAIWPAASAASGPEAAAVGRPQLLTTLRRVVAQLLSDSGPVPALALGLRSGGVGVRQLVLAAEGLDIDLRVAPAAEGAPGWVISGQVLGPETETEGEACLSGDGVEDRRMPLSEMAEFRFGPLPVGRWRLSLVVGTLEIELPPLDITRSG
jgi:hypothetical protein